MNKLCDKEVEIFNEYCGMVRVEHEGVEKFIVYFEPHRKDEFFDDCDGYLGQSISQGFDELESLKKAVVNLTNLIVKYKKVSEKAKLIAELFDSRDLEFDSSGVKMQCPVSGFIQDANIWENDGKAKLSMYP